MSPEGKFIEIGDRTECGLLKFLTETANVNYSNLRIKLQAVAQFPFTSDSKRMSTVVSLNSDLVRVYSKGAPEMILFR
jgi:Ca2+-transporting ATPase